MGLLGEFVKIKTGKLDANAAIEGGKYPFFTCSKTNLAIDDYAFNADAVLVAGNGDLNVKHYKGKFNAYQRTYVITVENTEILDSRYLYHWMSKYVDRLRELSIGGVIKYIKLGMLTDAEFPLPPLEEQKRIAAILDKADAIRRKRQQAIDLTDQLLRSVFLDMFGNPVSNPKGWPVESLGIHLSFVTSGSRGWAKYYSEDGALFIRSLDVHMNELVFGEAAFVSPPENAEAKRTMVYKGDVLLTITGSRIGRVAPVRDDLGQAHISQHVAIIRLNETLNAEFLSMFLSDINGGKSR